MILIIRGHIRNSFENNDLYSLIKNIYHLDNTLTIYIHTWNIFSNNISWRRINTNNTIVTQDIIYTYFKDISNLIKKIIIDDDTKISLIGNISGKICRSAMPTIGWKNYWYGKYAIVNELDKSNKTEMVINIRFDVLNNSFSIDKNLIINHIQYYSNKPLIKNVFMYNRMLCGIDNYYIGNVYTMYILTYTFNYFLDNIIRQNKNISNQEYLVYIVNEQLFSPKPISSKINLLKDKW